MRQDPIVIEAYDHGWADSFRTQKAAVEDALRDWLVAPVEHIGSTSVPELPAKPIIDMLAVTANYEAFSPALAGLQRIGWVAAPEPDDAHRRKWSVCFPGVEHRTHHLHVVERESAGWRDWLLFRDYLRTHVDDAARYARLKTELAAADQIDRARYRSGKAPLISELMERARAWRVEPDAASGPRGADSGLG